MSEVCRDLFWFPSIRTCGSPHRDGGPGPGVVPSNIPPVGRGGGWDVGPDEVREVTDRH